MEELLSDLEQHFCTADAIEQKWMQNFEDLKTKLNGLVCTGVGSQTPQQTKKKTKRLSVIYDTETNGINNEEQPEICVKEEPQNGEDTSIRASRRPVRAAKLKIENMKLPTLNGKLRRGSRSDDTLSKTVNNQTTSQDNSKDVNVIDGPNPKERTSTTSTTSTNDEVVVKKKNSNENKRKDSTGSVNKSIEPSKKVDESLLIVPNGDDVVCILSDEEAEKMPPPAVVPKKKKAQKVVISEEDLPQRTLRNRIKVEKQSLDSVATKEDSVKISNESQTVEVAQVEVKQEKIDGEKTEKPKASGSKRGRKAKKALKHKPIKEEKRSSLKEHDDKGIEEPKPEETNNSPRNNSLEKRNQSQESIYEDALGKLPVNNPQLSVTKSHLVVMVEKLNSPAIAAATKKSSLELDKVADATFVSAKDVQVTDATFTAISSEKQTFIMDTTKVIVTNNNNTALDATRVIPASNVVTNGDATFCVENMEKTQADAQEKEVFRSSIMTEEDSINESMPPPVAPIAPLSSKAKSKNELFNPFVQSPVKKKVEAFEKIAVAIPSPQSQRQTRIRSKMLTKENKDPDVHTPNLLGLMKSTTPLIGRHPSKLLTPSQHQNITPNILTGPKSTKIPSSNSKISHLQKSSSTASITSKSQSLSRDNSAEDLKRGLTKQQLEEKKKKREFKQQQAALARETKEKERAEKLQKAIREREEKMRRKAMEAEQKKQLDEINKNLKLQEEKREAQKRMERQKQIEQEMAEAARKERELLDNLKIQKAKEELHQKLLQNQKLQQQKKSKKTAGKGSPKYDFDMLNSDDSTDDEAKVNPKRPSPPIWSKSNVRQILMEQQSHLSTKIIDNFFSVKPMTPDLREIFPAIDPRNLKRNSSMYWNTPPRYSQLPKY